MALRFVKSFNLGGGFRFVFSKRIGGGRKAAAANKKFGFWNLFGYCVLAPFLLSWWLLVGMYKLTKLAITLGIKGIKKAINWIRAKKAQGKDTTN